MKARCLIHTPVNRVELQEVEVRDPAAGEVLVEAVFTCISPGTELRCLRMDREKDGFVPGYAFAGRILKCGKNVTLEEGAAVLIGGTRHAGKWKLQWGGHISHAIIAAAEVCPIPPGVSLLEASIARLAAIPFHGLRLSHPAAWEKVAVIGLGIIGQLSARLHQLSGARVVACDCSQQRVTVARAAGIEAIVVEGTMQQTFHQAMPGGADIIVDATGAPSVLPQALAVGKNIPWTDAPFVGLRYLIQGSYENGFEVPYQETFCKETSFIVPRSFQTRDLTATLDLIVRKRLAVQDLVMSCQPEKAAEIYAELRKPDTKLMTAAFQWTEGNAP